MPGRYPAGHQTRGAGTVRAERDHAPRHVRVRVEHGFDFTQFDPIPTQFHLIGMRTPVAAERRYPAWPALFFRNVPKEKSQRFPFDNSNSQT